MAKKALVLVQGINSNKYLEREISISNLNLDAYDKVVQVKTEKVFDQSLIVSIVKYLPFMGKKVDQFGDIYQYFINESTRKLVSGRVTRMVKSLRADGYDTVDVLAHSLGTVITLTSEANIDTFISLGCPLSISAVSGLVQNHTKKIWNALGSKKVKIKNMYYVYSNNDLVCKRPNESTRKMLSQFNCLYVDGTDIVKGMDHNSTNYANNFALYLARIDAMQTLKKSP